MKKTIVSLILVFVLVCGLCLTSCSEDAGKKLIQTAKTDYPEYNKAVIENVCDAIARSYAPLSIIKDSFEDGKMSASFEIEDEEGLIEFFSKNGSYAAFLKDVSTGEGGAFYYADKNVTIDLTGIKEAGMEKVITFSLDIFKDAVSENEEAAEGLEKIKEFIKFDFTNEKAIEKVIDKFEDCFDRKIEEKSVKVGEDKTDCIVVTEKYDTDTVGKFVDILFGDIIDYDAIIAEAVKESGTESADIPTSDMIKEMIAEAFTFNGTQTYAVSMDKGLPVLYTFDLTFGIDPSTIIYVADEGIDKMEFDINVNVEFPKDMSVYNPFTASVTISGDAVETLVGEDADELSIIVTWEPEDSKEEFNGDLKFKLKAAGMAIIPLSVSIDREKKTGDFTATVKAGIPGEITMVIIDGNIKSEKKKTTIKFDSIRIDDDTEKIDVTLTFEKGCDFPTVPAGEKITDIEDFENVLP